MTSSNLRWQSVHVACGAALLCLLAGRIQQYLDNLVVISTSSRLSNIVHQAAQALISILLVLSGILLHAFVTTTGHAGQSTESSTSSLPTPAAPSDSHDKQHTLLEDDGRCLSQLAAMIRPPGTARDRMQGPPRSQHSMRQVLAAAQRMGRKGDRPSHHEASRHRGVLLVVWVCQQEDVINLHSVLPPSGYRIITAHTQQQLMDILDSQPAIPDVLLVDTEVPAWMDGGLLTAVRTEYNLAQLPIITFGSHKVLGPALAAGATDHLDAPVVPTELSARIHSLVKAHQCYRLQAEATTLLTQLQSLAPASVLAKVHAADSTPQTYIAQLLPETTVLFLGILNFTTLSAQWSTHHAVGVLHEFTTALDDLLVQHGCYKAEQSGGLFTVVAGHDGSKDHALRIMRVAAGLVTRAAAPVCGERLQICCGIHSGVLHCGVVGLSQPHFTAFGGTLVTAMALESICKPNCVMLSASAASRLREQQQEATAAEFTLLLVGTRKLRGVERTASVYVAKVGDWHTAAEPQLQPLPCYSPQPGSSLRPSNANLFLSANMLSAHETPAHTSELRGLLRLPSVSIAVDTADQRPGTAIKTPLAGRGSLKGKSVFANHDMPMRHSLGGGRLVTIQRRQSGFDEPEIMRSSPRPSLRRSRSSFTRPPSPQSPTFKDPVSCLEVPRRSTRSSVDQLLSYLQRDPGLLAHSAQYPSLPQPAGAHPVVTMRRSQETPDSMRERPLPQRPSAASPNAAPGNHSHLLNTSSSGITLPMSTDSSFANLPWIQTQGLMSSDMTDRMTNLLLKTVVPSTGPSLLQQGASAGYQYEQPGLTPAQCRAGALPENNHMVVIDPQSSRGPSFDIDAASNNLYLGSPLDFTPGSDSSARRLLQACSSSQLAALHASLVASARQASTPGSATALAQLSDAVLQGLSNTHDRIVSTSNTQSGTTGSSTRPDPMDQLMQRTSVESNLRPTPAYGGVNPTSTEADVDIPSATAAHLSTDSVMSGASAVPSTAVESLLQQLLEAIAEDQARGRVPLPSGVQLPPGATVRRASRLNLVTTASTPVFALAAHAGISPPPGEVEGSARDPPVHPRSKSLPQALLHEVDPGDNMSNNNIASMTSLLQLMGSNNGGPRNVAEALLDKDSKRRRASALSATHSISMSFPRLAAALQSNTQMSEGPGSTGGIIRSDLDLNPEEQSALLLLGMATMSNSRGSSLGGNKAEFLRLLEEVCVRSSRGNAEPRATVNRHASQPGHQVPVHSYSNTSSLAGRGSLAAESGVGGNSARGNLRSCDGVVPSHGQNSSGGSSRLGSTATAAISSGTPSSSKPRTKGSFFASVLQTMGSSKSTAEMPAVSNSGQQGSSNTHSSAVAHSKGNAHDSGAYWSQSDFLKEPVQGQASSQLSLEDLTGLRAKSSGSVKKDSGSTKLRSRPWDMQMESADMDISALVPESPTPVVPSRSALKSFSSLRERYAAGGSSPGHVANPAPGQLQAHQEAASTNSTASLRSLRFSLAGKHVEQVDEAGEDGGSSTQPEDGATAQMRTKAKRQSSFKRFAKGLRKVLSSGLHHKHDNEDAAAA